LRLRREYSQEPLYVASREKGWSKAQDPERRAKLAEAMRDRPWTEEMRRKMSEAWKGRGRPPAWRAWEDQLVGVLPDAEVAARTGRTLVAVVKRRRLHLHRAFTGEPVN
jgi:hypothetical protein